jgi:hypothetical protein
VGPRGYGTPRATFGVRRDRKQNVTPQQSGPHRRLKPKSTFLPVVGALMALIVLAVLILRLLE